MARSLNFLPKEGTAARLLPWVIAVMVLLSGLAIALGAALHDAFESWRDVTARSVTVQIVNPDAAALETETTAALKVLRDFPGVATVEPVPEDRTAELLSPWLGDDLAEQDLPLPRMIDVTLAADAQVDMAALRKTLRAEAPNVQVDSHATWLDNLLSLSRTIELVALGVIGLVGIATVAIIVFATLSRLAAYRDNIEIVHLMGAKDGTIAREFQWRFLGVGFKGGIIGLAFVVLVLSVIIYYGRRLEAGLLPDMAIGWPGIAALLALPVISGLMTMITARITVMRVLARLV